MGIFKNFLNSVSSPNATEPLSVVFDQDWQDSMESIKRQFLEGKISNSVRVIFPPNLLEEIDAAIENHQESERVPYAEVKIPINNVGESFRQDEIREMCNSLPGQDMDWLSGFLMPEVLNPHDKNAVGVYAIHRSSNATGTTNEFEATQVGYMDKESAAKVHTKIINLLGKNLYVPLLIRMTGGTDEKPEYGAFPYVMTDLIKFP